MNKQQIKKFLPLMEAWANDEEIQFLTLSGEWKIAESPFWDINIEYRIKPPEERVPFDLSDAPDLRGKWVVEGDCSYQIIATRPEGVSLGRIGFVNFLELSWRFKFTDGTPCSKLKN